MKRSAVRFTITWQVTCGGGGGVRREGGRHPWRHRGVVGRRDAAEMTSHVTRDRSEIAVSAEKNLFCLCCEREEMLMWWGGNINSWRQTRGGRAVVFGGRRQRNSWAKGRGKIREGREKRKGSAGQMVRLTRKSRSMYSQHKNGTTT